MATITEIVDELDLSLDYEEGSGSVAKAERVVTLCKQLLIRRPSSSGHAGSSVQFDANQLRAMLEDARIFLKNQSSSGAPGVRFLGVDPRR
jgi:hypothetical protein